MTTAAIFVALIVGALASAWIVLARADRKRDDQ